VTICDYTNRTLKAYLNGTYSGTVTNLATPIFPSASKAKYIGAYSSAEYRISNGYLDDMRIYNRALSASEISQIYNQTKSNYQ